MEVIFDSRIGKFNGNFGAGIVVAPRKLTRSERSELDQAWHCGFSAGKEDGLRALPPASYNDAQAAAFHAGVDSAVVGEWSDAEVEERARQAEWEDRLACGFVGA